MRLLNQKLIAFYLEYVNSYLTTCHIADDYEISINEARELIAIGKRLHEDNVNRLKLERLKYIRQAIEAESVSQGEISELYDLRELIHPSDTLLLEWAGVPEDEYRQNMEAIK